MVYLLTWLSECLPNIAKVKNYFFELAARVREASNIKDRKTRATDKTIMLSRYWSVLDSEMYKGMLQVVEFAAKQSLMNFNSKEDLTIYTDASKKYWGAVVVQQGRPLLFLSGKFSKAAFGWSINDKELWPIVFTLRRFSYLIENTRKVTVRTDHKNITYLTDEKTRTPLRISTDARLARWNLFILNSGAKLEYIPGEENTIADLLSRWSYPDFARTLKVQYRHLTRSSGWTPQEELQLRKLIQKYGVGSWKRILATFLLPGKTISQMVKRFSILTEKQAFSEFSGLRVDPLILREYAQKKQGFYRNNIFINTAKTNRELLQRTRIGLQRALRDRLNHYIDIFPLKREEIGGKFFEKASPEDKLKYTITLEEAEKELKLRIKCLEYLTKDGHEDANKRLDTWIHLRWVLEELKEVYDKVLTRPRSLISRQYLLEGKYVAITRKVDLGRLEKEWILFLENRLSPFSPLTPLQWTEVDKKLIEDIKATNEVVPDFIVRKLLWQIHYKLGHANKENEIKEARSYGLLDTKELKDQIEKVRSSCLHCNRKPNLMRRPLNKNLHSITVNKILHLVALFLKQTQKKKFTLVLIGTNDNTADVFTKPLGKLKFQFFRDLMIT